MCSQCSRRIEGMRRNEGRSTVGCSSGPNEAAFGLINGKHWVWTFASGFGSMIDGEGIGENIGLENDSHEMHYDNTGGSCRLSATWKRRRCVRRCAKPFKIRKRRRGDFGIILYGSIKSASWGHLRRWFVRCSRKIKQSTLTNAIMTFIRLFDLHDLLQTINAHCSFELKTL